MDEYVQPYTNSNGEYNRPGRALQMREMIIREYPEFLEEFSRKRILIGANIMGVGMTRSNSPERTPPPPEKTGWIERARNCLRRRRLKSV